MKEYKIIKSELKWKDNIKKFEDTLNDHARQGWEVKDIEIVGDVGNSFIALLQKERL